jgi:hypothetical protein
MIAGAPQVLAIAQKPATVVDLPAEVPETCDNLDQLPASLTWAAAAWRPQVSSGGSGSRSRRGRVNGRQLAVSLEPWAPAGVRRS